MDEEQLYLLPKGIAKIFRQLNAPSAMDEPLSLLRDIRRIITVREASYHSFFNNRQPKTRLFYAQCAASIDILLAQNEIELSDALVPLSF